jgi:hypothetical protein
MYVFQSEFKRLVERVELLETIIGEDRLKEAEDFIDELGEEACLRGEHDWKRTAYDLLQGKWGENTCQRCGKKETWHV